MKYWIDRDAVCRNGLHFTALFTVPSKTNSYFFFDNFLVFFFSLCFVLSALSSFIVLFRLICSSHSIVCWCERARSQRMTHFFGSIRYTCSNGRMPSIRTQHAHTSAPASSIYYSIWHFLRLLQNQQRILPLLLRRRLRLRRTRQRHVQFPKWEMLYVYRCQPNVCCDWWLVSIISRSADMLFFFPSPSSSLSASQEWELLSKITTAFLRAVPSECDRLAVSVFVLTMRAIRRIKLVHDGIFLSVRFFSLSVFTVLSLLLLWLCRPEYLSYMFKIRIKWQLILKGAFLSAFRFSIE